jgi:hypothetical protein
MDKGWNNRCKLPLMLTASSLIGVLNLFEQVLVIITHRSKFDINKNCGVFRVNAEKKILKVVGWYLNTSLSTADCNGRISRLKR